MMREDLGRVVHIMSPSERTAEAVEDAGVFSYESLPDVGRKCFDSNAIKKIVADVVQHYGVGIGFLALEAEDALKLKARCGYHSKTACLTSIARHNINRELPIIIEDASILRRFTGDPLVAHEPFVRFAAIAPLMLAPGTCIGSLCIMDPEPRTGVTLQSCQMLCDASHEIIHAFRSADITDFCAITWSSLPSADQCRTVDSLRTIPEDD